MYRSYFLALPLGVKLVASFSPQEGCLTKLLNGLSQAAFSSWKLPRDKLNVVGFKLLTASNQASQTAVKAGSFPHKLHQATLKVLTAKLSKLQAARQAVSYQDAAQSCTAKFEAES